MAHPEPIQGVGIQIMKCSRVAFLFFIFAGAAAASGRAQTADAPPANPQATDAQPARTPAKNAQPEGAQIDIGGSFYHAFTRTSTGNGTKQTPENNTNGGMFEMRYLASRYLGAGLAVSFGPGNQTFAPNGTYPTCGGACAYPVTTLVAGAIEVVPEYVPSVQFGRMRVFGVGGLGVYIVTTGASNYATTTRSRIAYVFGGGSDFSLTPRFGIRVQYRYSMYKAPDIASPGGYPATGEFTSSSEPMAGVFYTF
jgi:opacity protein-like surface antigen